MASRRRRYYARAKSWGGRAYRMGRTRTYRKGGFRARVGLPFIAGLALGMTNLDDVVPAPIKIIGACLPVQGPGIGTVKAVCQGMLIGDVVQKLTGISLPVPGITSGGSGGGILWG